MANVPDLTGYLKEMQSVLESKLEAAAALKNEYAELGKRARAAEKAVVDLRAEISNHVIKSMGAGK